jgi:glycosyltransferase involved in cell wall biosynthesis
MVDLTKPVAVMCFSGGAGGMERSAVRLARFLSSITTVVLVCKRDSFTENLYKEEGGHYSCESISFFSRVFSPAMMLRARAIVTSYGIDNVIFFGASELKTLYFAFLGKRVNLIVWHGTTKSKPKRDILHRLVYSRVNHHVALSEHLLRNVKQIVPESKNVTYRVIRPSFDIKVSNIKKVSIKESVIRIIHLGRIARGKGQVDAVLACKYLHDEGIKFNLKLIGSPDGSDYINDVNKEISRNGLDEFVNIAGYVNDVTPYLEAADILLFPSRGEGMPNAFIEALHYDMVCIAYDNTVFPEFIEMGFHVFLANDGDIADLSNKLLYVANNIELEKIKSINNVHLSRNYFQVGRELSQWLDILVK